MTFNEQYINQKTSQPKTHYLFIDESGNFDFSPQGTKWFILTGFATFNPTIKRDGLIKLRYQLLADGVDHEQFHATEDKQAVRDEVYNFLISLGNTYEVHSIIAQKNKAHSSLYEESYMKKGRLITRVTGMRLYQKLCGCLLQYVFRGKQRSVDKIVVVLGSLYVGDKKRTLLKTLKRYLKSQFPGVPFEIYSHQSCADLNCQLADYCCWAISVKAEREEIRPYEAIKPQIKSVFEIFRAGTTEYYQYE